MVNPARLSLASLWLSQTARNLADNCLRMFVVLQVARLGGMAQEAAWHQVAVAFYLPFILLAPINGALGNALPRHWVLAGASTYGLATVLALAGLLGLDGSAWVWCAGLGLSMIGAAIYSPARYAMLPAAAQDGDLPLGRVNGWIEMGGSGAVVAGLLLGIHLHDQYWIGLPAAVALVMGLNLLSALLAAPARFPSDVRRAEAPAQAIAGFFRDCRRVWAEPQARGCLLGLAFFLALMVAGSGAIIAHTGGLGDPGGDGTLRDLMLMVGLGVAAGSLLASIQGNPYRAFGQVTLGAAGIILTLCWALLASDLRGPAFVLGVLGGLVNVPLRAGYQSAVPADARGNAMAVSNTANYVIIILLSVLLFGLIHLGLLAPAGQLVFLMLLTLAATIAAGYILLRPTTELFLEFLFWPLYRIRARGPGKHLIPERGPLVIVGNHSAWFDPAWVAKITPRQLTPMMTSDFYDLPVIHFLVKHVFQVIRVQASRFRRVAPELDEAIRVVQRGGCVLLFPEGWMRRKDERLCRQFGQGIWHILRRCPDTPVVCCWIEGGWGSWTSHRGGPPAQNKRIDILRKIQISVQEPIMVPADILANHRLTREFLRRRILEARQYLGLEVPELEVEVEEEEEKEEEKAAG